MPKTDDRWSPTPGAPSYAPDVLPRLQDLLSALADVDVAYESDLEFLRDSAANQDLKTVAMGNLRQLHDRRRATLVRQLTKLEERLRA